MLKQKVLGDFIKVAQSLEDKDENFISNFFSDNDVVDWFTAGNKMQAQRVTFHDPEYT